MAFRDLIIRSNSRHIQPDYGAMSANIRCSTYWMMNAECQRRGEAPSGSSGWWEEWLDKHRRERVTSFPFRRTGAGSSPDPIGAIPVLRLRLSCWGQLCGLISSDRSEPLIRRYPVGCAGGVSSLILTVYLKLISSIQVFAGGCPTGAAECTGIPSTRKFCIDGRLAGDRLGGATSVLYQEEPATSFRALPSMTHCDSTCRPGLNFRVVFSIKHMGCRYSQTWYNAIEYEFPLEIARRSSLSDGDQGKSVRIDEFDLVNVCPF